MKKNMLWMIAATLNLQNLSNFQFVIYSPAFLIKLKAKLLIIPRFFVYLQPYLTKVDCL